MRHDDGPSIVYDDLCAANHQLRNPALQMGVVSEYRQLVNRYLPRPLRTDADYRRALKQVEKLMVPHPSPAASMLIEMLAMLIEQYESQHHPAPAVSPADMLAHCIAARGTTAVAVSKDTGIPQATISNVLARRRGISRTNAAKLGRYFNLPVSAFL
jgi:HTH-type transcriptional regulator/antitoxin HigA